MFKNILVREGKEYEYLQEESGHISRSLCHRYQQRDPVLYWTLVDIAKPISINELCTICSVYYECQDMAKNEAFKK